MKTLFSIVLSSLLFFSSGNLKAQEKSTYNEMVSMAQKAYEEKAYSIAAHYYDEAFVSLGGKAYPNDRYNAACSYALAEKTDSAFYHLFYLLEKSSDFLYNSYDHVKENDSDLDSLRRMDRWKDFMKELNELKEEKEKNMNLPLKAKLDSIYELDQGIRRKYPEMTKKYERGSIELNNYFAEMRRIDSSNEIYISGILDKYGWLGADEVGGRGNSTLFLVIQHAPLETQEKYLPMMQLAVKEGKASGSQLALLEDRIALRNNRPQIYGSQIGSMPNNGEKVVLPLLDPKNVNQRRAEVGLGPIEDYTERFGFRWDIDWYEENLPELEAIFLKNNEAEE